MNLKIGDTSENRQITIIDEDRLCYLVKSESRGAWGVRTISKSLLSEYIAYFLKNPNASANDARDTLSGQSDIDKFEYGYSSTLKTMAQMELGQIGTTSISIDSIPDQGFPLPFQQIFYGAPGTGKSHEVKKITGEIDGSKPNVFRTTFHPDTDYASFVGCYKPVMKPVPENLRVVAGREEDIAYEFVPQAFTDAYVYAYNNPTKTTYLVIEEINRGNCAQIFGDLFQLLDRNENGTSDYSIKADKDLAKYLIDTLDSDSPGIKDGKLTLPANLRILATMNTSDQSLFPIDSAFKRRWDWEYVAIDYAAPKSSAFTITIGTTSFRWVDFIKVVNQRIYDVTQSEDKQMGNFFIKSSGNQKQFCSKVMFYLGNEVLKDEVENSKYFFYEDKGNNQTSKFTFTDVYVGNATSVLTSFMKYLGVNPLQNQPAQNEEQQTDTDAQ